MKSLIRMPAVLALLLLMLPGYGLCSTAITVHVLKVGTYGNGNLYLSFDQPIDEMGCASAYIELPANAPGFKAIFAAATLAIATNATVEVKTDSCFNGGPSFSGARAGYLLLNKL